MIPAGHRQFVDDLLTKYAVPPLPAGDRSESLLGWTSGGGRSHVDVALRHPIKLLVNALGPPPPDVIERAHAQGVRVAALLGTVAQARKQVEAGVDIVIAQGSEAGEHTGEVSMMVLLPEVVDAISPTPVLAAGGIGTGCQAVAALAIGAEGVWTGSIWLAVKESDLPPALADKLLAAKSTGTVRSRAISGKPARQLRTAWTEAWDAPVPGTLPMPPQYMVTADATARLYRNADNPDSRAREMLGTPAGQIVGRITSVRSSREVMSDMASELVDTVARL